MNNKLQFIHCDTLFQTREEAKAYLTGGDLITITRPALYAEPMVVKYGDAANPNIILAIGSNGDGVTPSMNNKVFLIDFAELQESIENIKSEEGNTSADVENVKSTLAKIISACGFDADGNYVKSEDDLLKDASNLSQADETLAKTIKANYDELKNLIKSNDFSAESSSSIYHELKETENGTVLKSEVKIAPYKTVENVNLPNIILSESDGLYANVRMSYDENANAISFGVNDEVKTFNLPSEIHLVKGEYDTDTESLKLTLNNNEVISIDLAKLIGEWTVIGDKSETPIVLTKEEVTNKEVLRGADEYQDVLKADVRLADEVYSEVKDNILKRYNKNTLYVKGTADNIKYYDSNGNETTVQNALRNAKAKISTRDYNIIVEKEDGIYARANLSYSEATNTLTFDNGVDGIKTYKLNNGGLIEEARYDRDTESIILRFRYTDGTFNEVKVPLNGLFTEWDVDNENHTVTLIKSEHNEFGSDTLSADVKLANLDDNAIKVVGHALYVKGTADAIAYKDGLTVADALDNVASDVNLSEIRDLLDKEIEARKSADNEIKDSLNKESEARKEADEKNEDAIIAEQHRAEMAEQDLAHKIEMVTDCSDKVNELDKKVTELDVNFNAYTAKSDAVHTQLADKVKEVEDKTETNATELAKTNANLNAVSQKLDEHINNATGSIEGDVKALQSKVNDLQVKTASNETAIANVDAKLDAHVTDATAKFSGVESTLKTLDNEVDSLSINLSAVGTRLENHITESDKAHASLNETVINLNSKLADEIIRAKEAESNLSNAITAETSRAKGEESRLETLINTNANSIVSVKNDVITLGSRVDSIVKEIANASEATKSEIKRVEDALNAEIQRSSNKDTEIEATVNTVNANLTLETERAKEAEAELKANVEANKVKIESVETNLTNKIDSAVSNLPQMSADIENLKAEDKRLVIVPQESNTVKLTASKTDNGTVLSGEVKLRTDSENIIISNGNGIYAKVRLSYNKAENAIALMVNDNVADYYELSDHSLVENGYYDSNTQEIVLIIKKDGGATEEIRIPVANIINEWKVDNGANNPIYLSKTTGSDGIDILKAELEISNEAHNAILNQNGTLYVSNQAKDLTALWGGDEITIQKAIENIKTQTDKVESISNDVDNLKSDMSQVKNDITNLKGDVTNLETKVEQNTQDININKGSISNLTQQFESLSSQVTNLSNSFNELSAKVETYENRITKIEGDLTTINSNISSINTQLTQIKEEIGMTNPDEPSVAERLTQIEAILNDLIDFETYN